MLLEPWRIEMLGGFTVRGRDVTLTRFRTLKAAALLAYLAYFPRVHSRDELIERFWPGMELVSGRHNLRQSVFSLRRVLEPPGVRRGTVLTSDHASVRLNPDAFSTDVADFEAALCASEAAADLASAAERLADAMRLYRGDLLAGYYEEWIFPEQRRLAHAYATALDRLCALAESAGDLNGAIRYAQCAAAADVLNEETQRRLIRLYVAVGRPTEALHQYDDLERALCEHLGLSPSVETREAAQSARRAAVRRRLTTNLDVGAPRTLQAGPASEEGACPRRLPVALTRFFGREVEIERLVALLTPPEQLEGEGVRLVTITGPGGAGKTRLALEAARRLLSLYAGSAFFVPLADVTDVRLIPDTALEALALPRSPGRDPLAQIVERLSRRPSLLILDNFEHMIEGGAGIVRQLLQEIPALRCLLTSRRLLNVEGERELVLAPLTVPDSPGSPESLMEFPSVQLFVDRAQMVAPDFQITARNAEVMTALSRRLEGIPLAIELAAARALVLTPAQIAAQLENRLDFLVGRRQDVAARHRTLRAALEWSYSLLPMKLQQFFSRLSVFRGGCTLEAAQSVCQEPDALEGLQTLREHSLLLTEEAGDAIRFRMLETLREFAAEQLAPEERASLRRRHAEYFLALAEQAAVALRTQAQKRWLDRLQTEHDNLRAALEWAAVPNGDRCDVGLRLGAALAGFWLIRGFWEEGLARLEQLLAQDADGPPSARARALCAAGWLARRLWDAERAGRLSHQSLELCRRIGDPWGEAFSLAGLGAIHYDPESADAGIEIARRVGDPWLRGHALHCASLVAAARCELDQERTLAEESVALFRGVGDRFFLAEALRHLAHAVQEWDESDRASALAEEAKQIFEELDDQAGVAYSLISLGLFGQYRSDFAGARPHFEQALLMCRELADRYGSAHCLLNLGHLDRAAGDYNSARARYHDALSIFGALQDRQGVIFSVEGFAGLAAAEGNHIRAARLRGAAEAQREAAGVPLPANDIKLYERYLDAARAALGEEAFAAAFAEGRAVSIEQVVQEALRHL